MARKQFDTVEDYMAFVDQATRDGVRLKLYGGLEVEVPDDYTLPRGVTSGMADADTGDQAAETPPQPEPETVGDAEAERAAVVAEPPLKSENKDAWEEYARATGVDPEGMTKAEIISATGQE